MPSERKPTTKQEATTPKPLKPEALWGIVYRAATWQPGEFLDWVDTLAIAAQERGIDPGAFIELDLAMDEEQRWKAMPAVIRTLERLRLALKAEIEKRLASDKATDPMDRESRALGILVDHPDWAMTRIAKEVGCDRRRLYDMPKFKDARDALKSGKAEFPRGQKDADGNIEAFDE